MQARAAQLPAGLDGAGSAVGGLLGFGTAAALADAATAEARAAAMVAYLEQVGGSLRARCHSLHTSSRRRRAFNGRHRSRRRRQVLLIEAVAELEEVVLFLELPRLFASPVAD